MHITRLPGGRRVVTQISEVAGVDPETGDVQVADIFNFRDGESLQPTGYLPIVHRLADREGAAGAGVPLRRSEGHKTTAGDRRKTVGTGLAVTGGGAQRLVLRSDGDRAGADDAR